MACQGVRLGKKLCQPDRPSFVIIYSVPTVCRGCGGCSEAWAQPGNVCALVVNLSLTCNFSAAAVAVAVALAAPSAWQQKQQLRRKQQQQQQYISNNNAQFCQRTTHSPTPADNCAQCVVPSPGLKPATKLPLIVVFLSAICNLHPSWPSTTPTSRHYML